MKHIDQTIDIIERAFKERKNCCEAILIASDTLWELNLSKDTFKAAKFFEGGMYSGCSCGALVGIMMILGIINEQDTFNKKDANHLYKLFVAENGSSCCRALRKKQSMFEKFNKKGCCNITKSAMKILIDVVEGYNVNFGNNSNT